MAIFVAVDAVLVTVLLVVLALALTGSLAGLGRSGPSTAGTSSSSGSTPGVLGSGGSPSGTATAISLASFALPSGNIACTMASTGVRCTIVSITFTPSADPTCKGTIGHVFVLDNTGVHVPCVDGSPPGPPKADMPRLEYGLVSAVAGYTCASSTNGVRCVNDANGQGFDLARQKYSQLP
jgi:hypothetical protein